MSAADTHLQEVETLYSHHHGWLKAWLRRKLGCTEQAADLAHDTFLRILGARHAPSMLAEPRAYLTTTAKRLMIDRARHARIEQAYLAELALVAGSTEGAPSPEAIAVAVQVLAQLGSALSGLPDKGREVFLLHYLEGETQPAVASRLGISVRMVQKYLAQALLRCHQVLNG
ncbi:sigma-70 family RNA polymerase sigma factor [Cupriavidus sp. 30B13]|uniref:sigma-70 family RNA polymerase sigma factor n=1 Tax=Cupriavidus sp. 30B13 TaxID=3384241 RepID=UPI003B90C85A